MKEQILELIKKYVNVWDMERSGYGPVPIMQPEYHYLTTILEQLMCYREVRAIINWVGDVAMSEDGKFIIANLNESYAEDIILKAIEQYKSEQL